MDNGRREVTSFIVRVREMNQTCSDSDTETMSTSLSEGDELHTRFSCVFYETIYLIMLLIGFVS